MKAQNPNLKTMVAVGGYSPDMVTPWYTLAANSVARQNFARNIREFIARHYLDGVGMYGLVISRTNHLLFHSNSGTLRKINYRHSYTFH